MNSIKSIGIYLLGFIIFWIIAGITVFLIMTLAAAFPFLESLLSLNRFGEGFIALVFYGIALYSTCTLVGKISDKAKLLTNKILTAIGITLIILQLILALFNLINNVSIYWNIIGILPGIAFILWRNEF